MEFPSETAGNAGWIPKGDGIITPKEGRPRGKRRVRKISSKKKTKQRRNDLVCIFTCVAMKGGGGKEKRIHTKIGATNENTEDPEGSPISFL